MNACTAVLTHNLSELFYVDENYFSNGKKF